MIAARTVALDHSRTDRAAPAKSRGAHGPSGVEETTAIINEAQPTLRWARVEPCQRLGPSAPPSNAMTANGNDPYKNERSACQNTPGVTAAAFSHAIKSSKELPSGPSAGLRALR